MTERRDRAEPRRGIGETSDGVTSSPKTIEAELQQKMPDLPREKREMVVSVVQEHIEHHSGPLPSPRVLAEYDRISSGFAERIVSMAEGDLAHVQEMQRAALRAETRERLTGQIGALAVTLCALGTSGWIATSGYPVTGGLLGGATLLGIVSVFIGGREYLLSKIQKAPPPLQRPPRKKR